MSWKKYCLLKKITDIFFLYFLFINILKFLISLLFYMHVGFKFEEVQVEPADETR